MFREQADKKAERLLDRAFVKSYPPPRVPLPDFLDEHQRDGVRWVLTRSRSYLAHAPGAGKTCEAITAAFMAKGPGQVVFIVPPSLTVNWARETMRFYEMLEGTGALWPGVAIVPESARSRFTGWGALFLIVPDSMLTRDWVLDKLTKMEIRLLAVDEASRFKEPTAQRTIALFGGLLKGKRKTPGLLRRARHAVLLDGSPMPNRSIELWAPTYAMAPEVIEFMDQAAFGFRYGGARMNDYGRWEFKHSSHEAELKAKLQEKFMHVVTEDQLQHPERRRSIVFTNSLPRSPAQKEWETGNVGRISFNDISEEASQGDLARLRAELGLRKAPWVADYTRAQLDKGESVLLFCWHREVAFELSRALRVHAHGLVIGGTSELERETSFSRFQSGATKLIIGNIAAMGRGHNLQRADRVIFGEFSWTDETNKQAEKRASRRGSEREYVRCDYCVAPGTLDEPVAQGLFRKAERVKKVIG